jgi:hypothetical protein
LQAKNVSFSKDLIKEKKALQLNNVDTSDLDLWQVFFPINNLVAELANINLDGYLKLLPPSRN